jgi:hypothetical protein
VKWKNPLKLLLSAVLLLPVPGWGQAGGQGQALVQGSKVKIVVLQGEGALNSIKDRKAVQPSVEVRDANDKPVPGAEVVFQLPAAGPGAVFNGWMRTQTVRSDSEGKAIASGMTPNDEDGRFNITVTATASGGSASAVIAQSNTRTGASATAKKSNKKTYIIIGVLAAGAAIGGGIAATSGNGSSSSTPALTPVTITAGAITVGGPR